MILLFDSVASSILLLFTMPPRQVSNPWQRRLRRLFVFVGTASTFYILVSYALDRMRAARVKAIKDKKERDMCVFFVLSDILVASSYRSYEEVSYRDDPELTGHRMKSHFNSLTSTVTLTLYAILPTLQPQLFARYPVESTSRSLQSLSQPPSSGASAAPTPENSLLLERHSTAQGQARGETHTSTSTSSGSGAESPPRDPVTNIASDRSGFGESWASEFEQRDSGSVADSGLTSETDDEVSF